MSTKPSTFLFNLKYIDPSKYSRSNQKYGYSYLEQIYESILSNSNHFIVKSFKRAPGYDPKYAVKTYLAGQYVIGFSKDSDRDRGTSEATQDKNEATKEQNCSNQTNSEKMSEYKDLCLFLYIFLAIEIQDLRNTDKTQDSLRIPNFIKCLPESRVNFDYIIEKIKQKTEENTANMQKVEDDFYLRPLHDGCGIIRLYKNLEKPHNLHELLERIDKCLKEIVDYPLIGYTFLISAITCNISDTDIAAQILPSAEKETIDSMDLPIKLIDKPVIRLFGPVYIGGSNKPPCYSILHQKGYENHTIQYFYNIIPDIFLSKFKIDRTYKEFEKYKKEIEDIISKHEPKTENSKDAEEHAETERNENKSKTRNSRDTKNDTEIERMEERLKSLSKYYNECDKMNKEMFQLAHSAKVNLDNIQRTLSVFNLPRKLLFEDCFYESERKVKEMEFYSDFYYRETSKIEDDIRSIEIESNILRNKLQSVENKQNELRNIILAVAGIVISLLQVFDDQVKSFISNIFQMLNIIK